MRHIGVVILFLTLYGCAVAPRERTTVIPVDTNRPKVGKTVTVGTFVDNRFPFWPRKEAHTPLQKDKSTMVKDFEPLAATKEVRIPMGEVRSRLAHALKISGRFEEIIAPPTTLTGESLPEILKKALETSDYLVVGEVNAFDVKIMGANTVGVITLPVDMILLGLPNIFAFLLTGGKSFILTGGLFAGHTAECYLAMSVTIYTVETGNPLTTFRLETRAMCPINSIAAFGDLGTAEDDWIDLGRQLGDVALSNACAQAIEEVALSIQKESTRKGKGK